MAKRCTKPRWSATGLPMNLEAAAADGLSWLEFVRDKDWPGAIGDPEKRKDLRERLGRCVDALTAGLRGEFAQEVAGDPALCEASSSGEER